MNMAISMAINMNTMDMTLDINNKVINRNMKIHMDGVMSQPPL